ncbi:putative acetyl-CoA C-acyltransferase [Mycosarcoma maydis]|uniref:acetyl-CoA C-acyltransferase n=1 Tax=Mycosarcoma maydis TaxID=5270 RepID=A0A0D1E6H3_MYCMD|nr:putative acetyl-CoA C-acyltransferase [Ustilago maydis 521]KIS71181.1 putative acetyl-CoA C-acyltransferase [Ustilago maydis 521]|eukprot:XP_011387050.1 putative acetyl-CoA C-acyltransferase [Ustilago maydis 521]
MAQRITQLASHLDPRSWSGKGLHAHMVKNDSDVVIVAAGRTPFTKAYKGSMKDSKFDLLCYEFFKSLIASSAIDPALIQDIVVGNVHNDEAPYYVRAAALAAGIPNTTPAIVVNRFCSSGLMAIRTIANGIQAGEIECGLACGIEHMSTQPKRPTVISEELSRVSQEADDCKMPMGWTSENVAKDFNISRAKMDEYAARSHLRAIQAQSQGKFDAEIFPISVPTVGKDGAKQTTVVSADEGPRAGTTAESLGKIKSAFPQWAPSNTTGGNASQITDGAAGVILMRRSLANKLGLKVLGKYVSCAVTGLEPRIMGIGPSSAIPALLAQTGVKQDEVDLFEINEAFASMYVYCVEKLGLDPEKVNVNGGACALGHPLGATGARLVVTALKELERRQQKVAVVSMCIGLGMGAAGLILRED